MERTPFGAARDGRAVDEIILDNGILRCSLLTYGAARRGLVAQGRRGPVDTVLGFDRMEDYEAQDQFMGAVVGRYANRIAGGRFTLDGQSYILDRNDGENHLHGGPAGFFPRSGRWSPGGNMARPSPVRAGTWRRAIPGGSRFS